MGSLDLYPYPLTFLPYEAKWKIALVFDSHSVTNVTMEHLAQLLDKICDYKLGFDGQTLRHLREMRGESPTMVMLQEAQDKKVTIRHLQIAIVELGANADSVIPAYLPEIQRMHDAHMLRQTTTGHPTISVCSCPECPQPSNDHYITSHSHFHTVDGHVTNNGFPRQDPRRGAHSAAARNSPNNGTTSLQLRNHARFQNPDTPLQSSTCPRSQRNIQERDPQGRQYPRNDSNFQCREAHCIHNYANQDSQRKIHENKRNNLSSVIPSDPAGSFSPNENYSNGVTETPQMDKNRTAVCRSLSDYGKCNDDTLEGTTTSPLSSLCNCTESEIKRLQSDSEQTEVKCFHKIRKPSNRNGPQRSQQCSTNTRERSNSDASTQIDEGHKNDTKQSSSDQDISRIPLECTCVKMSRIPRRVSGERIIFVSLAEHSNAHEKEVMKFCHELEKMGFSIRCDMWDQLFAERNKNCHDWIDYYFKHAEFILICISPLYYEYTCPQPSRREIEIAQAQPTTHRFHTRYIFDRARSEYIENGSLNYRFLPVIFTNTNATRSHLPEFLHATSCYSYPETTYKLKEFLLNV